MKQKTIYAEVLEEQALAQFESAMEQPFVTAGALMPDAHTGYSLPIGAVIAAKDTVVPSWVGYDIGCGMCALKLDGVDRDKVSAACKYIFDEIYNQIPVGFHINETETEYNNEGLTAEGQAIADKKNYKRALGSLGGGNHFIEVGSDDADNVWVVIHSGSRGVGHTIASHYMKLASSSAELLAVEFDKNSDALKKHNPDKYEDYKARWIQKRQLKARPKEGHYGLSTDSQLGQDYIQDLNWCLQFALDNRKEMMRRVVDIVLQKTGTTDVSIDVDTVINRNHNHATYKDGVWVHRKGATHAEDGMLGVIPGNMRDGSFIVRGKGNPDSLYSSSHGAGRVLSRSKAKATLKLKDFEDNMHGIQALVGADTLDEAPDAYKNIYEVMDLQSDLVEVVTQVRPLINIKG